jgi:hypothetical protein
MGGKSSAPPPPDYAGAAQQTAAGNVEAARLAARANRVDQYTPQGSRTFTELGNDRWREDVQLSPEQQRLYDQDNAIKQGLSSVSSKGLGYVQNALDSPFDQSKLPQQMVNAGETGQAALLRRMQPQLDRDREALRTQLLNQGLTQNSEAYDREMERADRQANDAYSQAALSGITVGQQARQQGLQEQNFFRNEPLNMLNAVRTGQQVVNPTFTNVPTQQVTQGPDMLEAANMGYNAQMGAVNARNANSAGLASGLFSLGSAAVPFAFSDARLKTVIYEVGLLDNGINVYVFRWRAGPKAGQLDIGVLAQDVQKVMPDAVREVDGYLQVNYQMVLQ